MRNVSFESLHIFIFRIMEALSAAHDFGGVFSCCKPCTKNKRCKQIILVITFSLMTFDLITDWINWKQWSEVGGYNICMASLTFSQQHFYV